MSGDVTGTASLSEPRGGRQVVEDTTIVGLPQPAPPTMLRCGHTSTREEATAMPLTDRRQAHGSAAWESAIERGEQC